MTTDPGAPYPTTISYDADDFGEVRNLRINGQPVTACKDVTIHHETMDYNTVTLELRGVRVVANGVTPGGVG